MLSAGGPGDVLPGACHETLSRICQVQTIANKCWHVNKPDVSSQRGRSGNRDPKVQKFRIVQVGTIGMAGWHGNMMDDHPRCGSSSLTDELDCSEPYEDEHRPCWEAQVLFSQYSSALSLWCTTVSWSEAWV